MRKLTGVILGLCLVAAPATLMAADHTGDPHWIQDSRSGCWVYNRSPDHDEAMAWEGPSCSYGEEANGVGTVTWFKYNTWVIAEKGEMQNGMMQGPWIRRFANGNVENSYWVDGLPQQQPAYADESGGGDTYGDSSSTYTPTYNGDAYMETLRRQNRENCERAAKGANIICNPQ